LGERTGSFELLSYSIRAMRKEVVGFKFAYPLQVDTEAGSKDSLHYYLYSDSLSWDAMRLDAVGIPRTWDRLYGTNYLPGYIAWYGLVHLGHYLRRGDQTSLDVFLKQISWLETHAVVKDGAAVWTMNFDYLVQPVLMKAPWISAHVQGLVISALVRGWRVTRRPYLLELLKKSAKVFESDVEDNGLRIRVNQHSIYTEIPGSPPPGILDGFMTSLLGLYDLFVETADSKIGQLFTEGIDGLKYMLPKWNYRNKWSWYNDHAYLCPPAYHCLNRLLLTTLGRLSNESCFAECAKSWDPNRLSSLERIEIFLAFVATKNACRIRHQTWRKLLPRDRSKKDQCQIAPQSQQLPEHYWCP
jgi:hypothetical protein